MTSKGSNTLEKLGNEWHLSKSLTITVISVLLANTIGSVWWAASLTKQVEINAERPILLERVIRLEAVTDEYRHILTRFINVMDKMDNTVTRIDREQARRLSIIKNAEQYFGRPRKRN